MGYFFSVRISHLKRSIHRKYFVGLNPLSLLDQTQRNKTLSVQIWLTLESERKKMYTLIFLMPKQGAPVWRLAYSVWPTPDWPILV